MMSSEKTKWYPTPSYLSRRYFAKSILKQIQPTSFLEIGIGYGGGIVDLLAKNGFMGKGIDLSPQAIESAKNNLAFLDNNIIKLEAADLFKLTETYNLIIAFEVLEHIEDEERFITKLFDLLNENGIVVISVPAHMKKWSVGDEAAGHLRRYERKDLIDKFERSGFVLKYCWSYGFPLVNLSNSFSHRFLTKKSKKEQIRLTMESSERKYNTLLKYFFKESLLQPFFWIQNIYKESDLGVGYFLVAQKRKGNSV